MPLIFSGSFFKIITKGGANITIWLHSVYKAAKAIDHAEKWCYTFNKRILPKGDTVMKTKFTAAMILSAMLLTACNSETSLIDDIETSGTTATAQAVQVVQGGTQSDKNDVETNYILGGGTETTVSVTETTTETEPADKEVTLDVQKIDISGILEDGERFNGSGVYLSGDIAAVTCYKGVDGGAFFDGVQSIRFFNINDLTVKANITAPDGWEFDDIYLCPCIEGSGDVFCKIQLSRFDSEKLEDEYAALIVRNDFTAELAEGDSRETLSFPVGNHNISDHAYDLFDADSGEVIVEGFNDAENYGISSKWFYYICTIDNDRFVYRTAGYESLPGFGYYDFTAGQAVNFPESRNFLPVGYHDGKVYAEQGAWDGMCQGELYTFDIETLEAEHFISSPAAVELDDYTEYYMPPNGEYIIASHYDRDNDDYANSKNIIFIISPDSGEVLAQQEFGSEYDDLRFFAFIDGNRFAAFNYNTKEVVIFYVEM